MITHIVQLLAGGLFERNEVQLMRWLHAIAFLLITWLIVLIIAHACTSPPPEYAHIIERYGGRDDLTVEQKQVLWMAQKKQSAVQMGNERMGE